MIELNVGDLVVKNPDTWKVTDFDEWERGKGVGVISDVSNYADVDVRWKGGRCYEDISEIKLFMTLDEYWRDRMSHRMEHHNEKARLFTVLKGFYCDAILFGDYYETLYDFWCSKRPYGSKALPESIAFNLGWDLHRVLCSAEIPDYVREEAEVLHAAVGVLCKRQDTHLYQSMLDRYIPFIEGRVSDPIIADYLADHVDSLTSKYPSILSDFIKNSRIEFDYRIPGIKDTSVLIIKEFWRKQNDVQS